MVSNEDRAAAIVLVGETLDTTVQGDMPDDDWIASMWPEESAAVIDVLIAHGWGPKPVVDLQRLNNLVTACTVYITLNPLTDYLEQAGIEVTYD